MITILIDNPEKTVTKFKITAGESIKISFDFV